jgi:adenylate kinase
LYFILMGPPGSGKGTQGSILARYLGFEHIATGDMFRAEVTKGTELGKLAKQYMDRGDYVPNEVTINMLLNHLEGTRGKGALLDGFPRTVEQAQALDDALKEKGTGVGKALYINVPEKELMQRLGGRQVCQQCGTVYNESTLRSKRTNVCDRCGGELYQRDDDKPETVKRRLDVYFEQTEPLLDYYREQDKLVTIDGEGSIEDVTMALLAAIGLERSRL